MTDEDISNTISSLAEKISNYHSRLMAVERELEKQNKEKNKKDEVKIKDG